MVAGCLPGSDVTGARRRLGAFVLAVVMLAACGGGNVNWSCTVTAVANGATVPLAEGPNGQWDLSLLPTADSESASNASAADFSCESYIAKNVASDVNISSIMCTCTTTQSGTATQPDRVP